MTQQSGDTIAAIATARGRAALAIVRLSGPQALAIAARSFRGEDLLHALSQTVHVGMWKAPDGAEIDQVVATIFRAPRSATGEDVIEISCHGGDYASARILESLVVGGARIAEPGEFTQRAFLNGKMDLAQAEAVADLIHASSSLAHRVSVAHLQGRYSEQLTALRDTLLNVCALAELEIDFAGEDVEFADRADLYRLLDQADELLSLSVDSYELGVLVREGVRVAIGGRPNAGKSTLLNALVGHDRAIVSAKPGTTRDTIEVDTEIDGIQFRFTDTAGLRDTAHMIEAEGVERAQRTIREARVILYVYDVSLGLEGQERRYLEHLITHEEARLIVVGNKTDLVAEGYVPEFCLAPVVALSAVRARRNPGLLLKLQRELARAALGNIHDADASRLVTNQRHRQHMQSALEAVRGARKSMETGVSNDLFTLDIRKAMHDIGAITGAVTNEDVLDQIFSRFCIGK